MKKIILVWVIAVVLAGTVSADEGDEYSNWNLTFDGNLLADQIYANGIAIDSQGFIYVIGSGTALISMDNTDWWIKKFFSNGTEVISGWNKTFDFGGHDSPSGITIDSDNNVYICGGGNLDWQIQKFSPDGTEHAEWNKTYDGNGWIDFASSITIDSKGDVYVAGSGSNIVGVNTKFDWWIKKFYANGTEITNGWDKKIDSVIAGTNAYDHLKYILVDSDDNLYAIGTGSDIVHSSSNSDWWIKKFNSSGHEDMGWDIKYGGSTSDSSSSAAFDSEGSIYITGTYGVLVGASVIPDMMLRKYNSSGDLQWYKRYGTSTSTSDSEGFNAIAIDSNDNIFVVGYIFNEVDPSSLADWSIKKFNTSGDEDTQNWDKYFNHNNGHDQAKAVALYNCDVWVAGSGQNLVSGSSNYDWWIKKFEGVATGQVMPIYTNFIPSAETTNFSEETNLTDVKNLTLTITGKGKIRFGQYGINAESANFDNHVTIENSVISVNTSALHSTFNNSATLTFEGVDCTKPYVYYSDTASTRATILSENNLCLSPRCTNIQCSAGTLTVTVSHFSGYAVNGTSNLTIDADDPKYTEQLVTFTAEYMNATGLITNAICNISFSDGSYIMDEQATYYNYSRTFASAQTIDYNVTCSAAGENTVFANDTAIINAADIPEFSTITLGLGLIAVLAGLIVIRKKR
ncbi:MAG: SBBP repeat-containing protein [Nanoarchaeota archaeon]|nr:SBBP repeat-containing protein [Nanoarchaeota archaeon]